MLNSFAIHYKLSNDGKVYATFYSHFKCVEDTNPYYEAVITVEATNTCPICGLVYTPKLAYRPDFSVKVLEKEQKNVTIQDLFPESTTIEIEQLVSGICSHSCLNKIGG